MTELEESTARLEAGGIVLAMLLDGRARIGIKNTASMDEAVKLGAMIWTPQEMFKYCDMSERERHIFRDLKHKFKATSEWVSHE